MENQYSVAVIANIVEVIAIRQEDAGGAGISEGRQKNA
jgi:hypothetical protein